jgi:hypothetical protein
MKMTLYDLLDANEFADIEDTFASLYKKNYVRNAVGYEEVFETLKEYDDVYRDEYVIFVTDVPASENMDGYTHVNGKKPSEEHSVCLSFTPWKEWLGMEIDEVSLKNYTGEEILCHCLWEMTFYGYNENDIQKVLSDVEMETREFESAEALIQELEDINEEAESRKILEKMLKNEIESSSSSDDGH